MMRRFLSDQPQAHPNRRLKHLFLHMDQSLLVRDSDQCGLSSWSAAHPTVEDESILSVHGAD